MRTFIAVELPDPIKERASSIFWEERVGGIVPVKKEAMHITLLFLGEISRRDAELLTSSLENLKASRFNVELLGLSSFPEGKPRVVFIKVTEGLRDLITLHKAVRKLAKQPIGITEENFFPHLTVARVKSREGIFLAKKKIGENKDSKFGTLEVNSIAILESKLTPSGPMHKELARIEF